MDSMAWSICAKFTEISEVPAATKESCVDSHKMAHMAKQQRQQNSGGPEPVHGRIWEFFQLSKLFSSSLPLLKLYRCKGSIRGFTINTKSCLPEIESTELKATRKAPFCCPIFPRKPSPQICLPNSLDS